jgi:predicted AAA+ superfamily ATPase
MVNMEISRDIGDKLKQELRKRQITVLVGARQVGKTFLLKKIAQYAKAKRLTTAFFDLEQPGTLNQFNGSDAEVVTLLLGAGSVIFIDEFHYLKNASHIFKALYDGGAKIKIFASGSSSLEIHRHLKESLAGRKCVHKISPCSFNEISQAVKTNTWEYYCKFGGLPGLVSIKSAEQKKMLLLDILQSYILKDIKSLIKEENIRAFNNLLYLLAQYQGQVVATANLANEVGLTARTVEAHLEILSQTYVNFPIHSYSRNYANELKKSKKYYLYDLGIRNALLKNFSSLPKRKDIGAIVESFVFLELSRQLTPETEIRFWRLKDGTEVDFIWIKNQVPYPIEVKSQINNKEMPRGLRIFIDKYPETKKAFVVNKNFSGSSKYKNTVICYKKWADAFLIPAEI